MVFLKFENEIVFSSVSIYVLRIGCKLKPVTQFNGLGLPRFHILNLPTIRFSVLFIILALQEVDRLSGRRLFLWHSFGHFKSVVDGIGQLVFLQVKLELTCILDYLLLSLS